MKLNGDLRTLALALSFLALGAGSADAKNDKHVAGSDHVTPEEESVCDELAEATPGLYGLCVAYCEALDGPSEIEEGVDIDSLDLEIPHARLLKNYERKMREGDPRMPCVTYTRSCPVWSQEELYEIGTHGWRTQKDYVRVTSQSEDYFDQEAQSSRMNMFAAVQSRTVDSTTTYVGMFYNRQVSLGIDIDRTMDLTQSEFESCRQQLIEHVTLD